MLVIAFIINIIIFILESLTLYHINKKQDIFKYYTYLQNFIALIVSFIFSIYFVLGQTIPEVVKGLRYVATCGLVATMFIFIFFLGSEKNIKISSDDFLNRFNPKTANLILHYICPLLSLISFLIFEREISLTNSIWTSIVAVPSCIYWIIYFFLSLTKKWQEPYNFSSKEKNNKIIEVLSFILIALSFIIISFILWNIS